tara:strand:- start:2790 stop:3023 length:234 start_codon:yes stop_codon:yes gene_type:complete
MPAKMVCGGVYERSIAGGDVRQGMLVSVTQHRDGEVLGTILFTGFAPETMREDSDQFQRLKLIGRPASPKIGRPRKE